MPSIASTEIIHPQKLTIEERQQLTDDLYAIHCQIFDGVDKISFAKYVVESKAQQTILHIHKNPQDVVVGYFAFHIFEKELGGKQVAVFRGEAGSLREYRGRSTNTRVSLTYILRYWLAHPRRSLYYLGTLVHPSSYLFCTKYGQVVWPNRTKHLPSEIATFMAELAVIFGLEAINQQNPLVVQVGWQTRDSEAEREYWLTCDKPDARFFVQENPNYTQGHGLITLVPLPISSLLHGTKQIVRERLWNQWNHTIIRIQQLPGMRSLVGVRDVQRRLQETPLFADVSEDNLIAVAQAAEVVMLPSGQYVFKSGDAGDELYVVAAGTVVVLFETNEAERLIDQIATGTIFGEIAMLSGERRSASIRTATKSTLIRIKRNVLLDLMATDTQMNDTIWSVYARRRLMNMTAGNSERFGTLSHKQRLDWLNRGKVQRLPAYAEETFREPWLYLLIGAVEVQQNGSWSTLRAPALLQVVDVAKIVAQSPTQIVCLPDLEVEADVHNMVS